MTFFSENYAQAKSKFVNIAKALGHSTDQLKLHTFGPHGEDLTIDIAVVGNLNSPKILIHTSGIHGVEGFAGSAIQLAALSKNIQVPSGLGLVFVHIINPFGMAWLRRVNENNVDLNRNFLALNETYSGSDPSYKNLDKILNFRSRVPVFWPELVYNLVRFGFRSLKSAIVQGQYDFPDGLFFGGHSLQAGPCLYKSWLGKNVGAAKKVLTLDVHTGLGGFGQEVLFCHTNRVPPNIGKKFTALSESVGSLSNFLRGPGLIEQIISVNVDVV